jgi:hypothetical protein
MCDFVRRSISVEAFFRGRSISGGFFFAFFLSFSVNIFSLQNVKEVEYDCSYVSVSNTVNQNNV